MSDEGTAALAEVIGAALTRRLREPAYWTTNPTGVRVRTLAAAVAADITERVTLNDRNDKG